MFASQKITRTEKILEFLQNRAEIVVNVLEDMTLSPGDFQREYKRFLARGGPRPFRRDWAEWYRQRRTYTALLSRLKRQGFIEKKEYRGTGTWKITRKGVTRLQRIREQHRNPFSLASAHFVPESRRQWTIIVFDIPEREKAKRRWLRKSLGSLAFTFLQKSVWIGKNGIPEEFMDALQERDLLDYVHILAVKKGGTLERIT